MTRCVSSGFLPQLTASCGPQEKRLLSPGAPRPLSSARYPLVGEAVPCLVCFGGVFIYSPRPNASFLTYSCKNLSRFFFPHACLSCGFQSSQRQSVAPAVLAFPPDRLSPVVNKQSQQLTGLTDPRLLGVTSHLHPARQFVTDL